MVLSLDIGNSTVSCVVFEKNQVLESLFIPVYQFRDLSLKCLENQIFLVLLRYNFSFAIVSSVVPSLNVKICNIFSKKIPKIFLFGYSYYFLLPIKIGVKHPDRIGTDLVTNACYAWMTVKKACAVVDFGTALTIVVVNDYGTLCGVTITPGIALAIKVLASDTEQLMEVPIDMPLTVLGNDTIEAIQAGVVRGYEFLVKGLLAEIERELVTQVSIFLTGGLGYLFKEKLLTFSAVYNRYFTLEGLYAIGQIIHREDC